MSAGVKDSSGTFTYPLCPMQGVITDFKLVLFCLGGTDSVRAELMPTSMDGDDGAEGGCECMGDDDGEQRVSECMDGEDRAERVCESIGGDEGAERLREHAFLFDTFFWLFLFAPAFAGITDLVLVSTSMDGDDGAEGGCERMGDDDGEERVSECMDGEDRAERVCESIGGDEGAERLCEHAFLFDTFFWLFLFSLGFAPTVESLSVFHRNSVPT